MCEHGTHIEVANLLAFNGETTHRRMWKIDACVASIVDALNKGGVDTVASCCGHGKTPGRIDLADGRILVMDFSLLDSVPAPEEVRRMTDNELEAQIIEESIDYLRNRFELLLNFDDITPWSHVMTAAEDRADWLRLETVPAPEEV